LLALAARTGGLPALATCARGSFSNMCAAAKSRRPEKLMIWQFAGKGEARVSPRRQGRLELRGAFTASQTRVLFALSLLTAKESPIHQSTEW